MIIRPLQGQGGWENKKREVPYLSIYGDIVLNILKLWNTFAVLSVRGSEKQIRV
jgi:hypothetical protein